MKKLFVATLTTLQFATCESSRGANLILADNGNYFAFDPVTGAETFLASGSLDSVVNDSFVVENGIAYQGGWVGGRQSAISATNLGTGTNQTFILSSTNLPQFGGFSNGNLILADEGNYYAFDPVTGSETYLASGSLTTVVNFSFIVENGIAYQGGWVGGRQSAISVTNLGFGSGASQTFNLSRTNLPQFGGFSNGNLILADEGNYYAFDPVTGSETFLASGSLDAVVNSSFKVENEIAYQGGWVGGRQSAISITNLGSGATRNFNLSSTDLPQFGGFSDVPEPTVSGLIVLGALFMTQRRSARKVPSTLGGKR